MGNFVCNWGSDIHQFIGHCLIPLDRGVIWLSTREKLSLLLVGKLYFKMSICISESSSETFPEKVIFSTPILGNI